MKLTKHIVCHFLCIGKVISNEKIKATEHQAVTNSSTTRQSLIYQVYPKNDMAVENQQNV